MHKLAGFLYDLDIHHLDHLAPLCALLNIPLICTHETPVAIAQEFYPNLDVRLMTTTEEIVQQFDAIITCLPKALIDPLFFFDEHKLRKKLLTLWLPHGNSDKDNLGALSQEKLALVYGEQMKDRFKEKGITAKTLTIGNYRKEYRYKRFPPPEKKTLLYAPTWNHSDVERDLPYLLSHLPSEYTLLVKLHPNTLTKTFYLKYDETENIRFVHDIPTIFPLLEKTDILITDTSSIAYDFLYFDRPIYFFTAEKTPVHRTGYITTRETLFKDLERPDIFDDVRKKLYHYAFAEPAHYKDLPKFVEKYFQNEIHLL